ncbi:MAG: DUF4335 domain-containing protein [Spirulina sp.]
MTSVVSLSSYEYAAGPWALRLTGQVSSLSAVAERVVLRRSRFQLWLWDGAMSDETYQREADTTDNSGEISRSNLPLFEVSGHGPDLADLTHLVQGYVQDYLDGQEIMPRRGLNQGQMSLTPLGLTRHRLTVVTASRSAEVTMSLLQLADLAVVLAQADQAVDLWTEETGLTLTPQRRTWRRLPLWTGSVAAVLVAAVLGSQWLGQIPLSVVQSPAPTAETLPPSEATQGGDAAPGGTNRELAGEVSPLETDSLAGEDGSAGLASDAPPPPDSAPASPLAASPAGPPPDVVLSPPSQASGTPAAPVAPRSPRADTPSRPRPSPEESVAAPLSPAPEADLSGPSSTAAELPSPAAAPARVPGQGERAALESSPENVASALADSASADWREVLRATLQEMWQPIPGLASPLRYRLSLGPSGEVLAVEPLTSLARQYLTQSGLPQVGDLLPNLQRPTSITVDVELLPSGEVTMTPDDLDPP